MHRAVTEVKKLSKFGTTSRTKPMFTKSSSNKGSIPKMAQPPALQTQCNPGEIRRDPRPLKAGSDEPLDFRHVVGDIVRCDLVTCCKPNSLVAGDVIHCFLKIFLPERNIDDEGVQAKRHDTA